MFLISTFSTVLSFQDVLDAFINYDGPGGAREFYHSQNIGWKHWMLAVEDAAQVVIGDAFLVSNKMMLMFNPLKFFCRYIVATSCTKGVGASSHSRDQYGWL
jgi:hypothetical protein